MIYALKVALQQIQERRRRGIKQDDNALLPREFLGRLCFLFTLFTTGAIPYYSPAVLPACIMSMSAWNHALFTQQRWLCGPQA